MSSVGFAFLVAIAMFTAGVLGLVLQRLLPEADGGGAALDRSDVALMAMKRSCEARPSPFPSVPRRHS